MSNTNDNAKTKAEAINACRLMDTVVTTPSWHQSLFTDSIQLFPDHILQEARHFDLQHSKTSHNRPTGTGQQQQQPQQQQDLNIMMAELQSLVERTRLEISEAISKNPALKSASSSLEMDAAALSSFDTASHKLIRAMNVFQDTYRQTNTSQLVRDYQQQYDQHSSTEQDTVAGLGEAARNLRATQGALLDMMTNIHSVQENISLLTDPSSQTQSAIASVQQDLICGSDDPAVEVHLDRLYTMSATLERALQRK
ncbi:hypothetical protein BGX33_005027 [Mortierella sp. NVP41]|nr:hypothetical protein BGX33_005027 [Mortierella sp. NVP41]